MLSRSFFAYRVTWGWLAVFLIYAISIFLSQNPLVRAQPELFTGITYDLTIIAPCVYLFIIWKTRIPKITALPVFVIGLIIATQIIPESQQSHLGFIEMFILPVIEIGVITLIIINIRKTLGEIRKNRQTDTDFYSVLKKSAISVLDNERLGKIFATEIAMIYFGLFQWRKIKPDEHQFTGYKENGIIAVYLALVFLVVIETMIVHLLLIQWYVVLAWVLLVLSLYAGVQILGHTKALMKRFTEINGPHLILRYGLFGDAIIDIKNIDKISIIKNEPEGKHIKKLAMLGGLERQNIHVQLTNPVIVESVYGIRKPYSSILFYIDKPKDLIDKLNGLKL